MPSIRVALARPWVACVLPPLHWGEGASHYWGGGGGGLSALVQKVDAASLFGTQWEVKRSCSSMPQRPQGADIGTLGLCIHHILQ